MPANTATSPLTWGRQEIPVPYVADWTGERVDCAGMTVRPDGRGLRYGDEQPSDRDHRGVLWARVTSAPGEGTPQFPVMHPARQRRVMERLLCQVCGGESSKTSKGWLFLLPGGPTEDIRTTKPPICEPCAVLAMRHCPHLKDPIAVRVRRPRAWGVYGDMWKQDGGKLVAVDGDGLLPYGHINARWFLATHLVLALDRCTRVPLPDAERRSRP
jgi:hypothetical protein